MPKSVTELFFSRLRPYFCSYLSLGFKALGLGFGGAQLFAEGDMKRVEPAFLMDFFFFSRLRPYFCSYLSLGFKALELGFGGVQLFAAGDYL